jgi:hypothetical protein
MKKIVPIGVVLILVLAALWFYQNRSRFGLDAKVEEFHHDADNLIEGLQQYKEFVGEYPKGSLVDIAKAISGQSKSEKKVVILASRSKKDDKGQIIDPWGTPLQFYFTDQAVLLRSAGPNQVFEDSSVPTSDDLFRTDVKK